MLLSPFQEWLVSLTVKAIISNTSQCLLQPFEYISWSNANLCSHASTAELWAWFQTENLSDGLQEEGRPQGDEVTDTFQGTVHRKAGNNLRSRFIWWTDEWWIPETVFKFQKVDCRDFTAKFPRRLMIKGAPRVSYRFICCSCSCRKTALFCTPGGIFHVGKQKSREVFSPSHDNLITCNQDSQVTFIYFLQHCLLNKVRRALFRNTKDVVKRNVQYKNLQRKNWPRRWRNQDPNPAGWWEFTLITLFITDSY